MRRIAILAALASVLVPASAAAGGDLPWEDEAAKLEHVSYTGHVDQPGKPEITFRIAIGRGGDPQYLMRIRTEPIEAACDKGTVTSGRIAPPAQVFPLRYGNNFWEQGPAGNRLHYTFYLHAHPQKVVGHLRVGGRGCSSGNLRFHTRLRDRRP